MKQDRKARYSKLLTSFLLFACAAFTAYAQPELGYCDQEVGELEAAQLPKAQEAWAKKNYREAERYLEKAVRYNPEYAHALYLLGKYMLGKKDFLKAEAIFIRLLKVCPDYKPEVKYLVGIMLLEGGKEQKAIPYLEQYLEDPEREFGYDKEVKAALVEAKTMIKLREDPVDFDPQVVQRISTEADEYLATISPDQQTMYFTRRVKRVNRMDGPAAKVRKVEEFSRAERIDSLTFEVGAPLPSPFNSNFNEGGPSVTADNSELYFTVCEDNNGYFNCDIYYSERDAYGGWTRPKSIGDHVNMRNSWESQPSVSAEGNVLYFASDREGGLGQLDLYRVKRNGRGEWSKPELLDKTINTSGNEKSPFIHSDSRTLYFTSDGHPGLGGYDIFYARFTSDSTWEQPNNIGYPINTESDELGLVVSLDGRTAYFASNQLRANSGWDIFQFSVPPRARPDAVALISGTIDHNSPEELEDASVEIKNVNSDKKELLTVDRETGNFARVVSINDKTDDLIVTIKKPGLAFSSKYIKSKELTKNRVLRAPLSAQKLNIGEEYQLNDINFETNSAALDAVSRGVIDEFVAYLQANANLKAEIQGHTDNVGEESDNKSLSERRAETVYRYVIEKGISANRLRFKGYGESKPVASNDTEAGRAKNRRTVFVITAQ